MYRVLLNGTIVNELLRDDIREHLCQFKVVCNDFQVKCKHASCVHCTLLPSTTCREASYGKTCWLLLLSLFLWFNQQVSAFLQQHASSTDRQAQAHNVCWVHAFPCNSRWTSQFPLPEYERSKVVNLRFSFHAHAMASSCAQRLSDDSVRTIHSTKNVLRQKTTVVVVRFQFIIYVFRFLRLPSALPPPQAIALPTDTHFPFSLTHKK